MEESKVPISRESDFFPSRSLEELSEEIAKTRDAIQLLDFFWGWPTTEVRSKCITQLYACEGLHSVYDSWGQIALRMEKTIRAELESLSDNDLWEQLLVWYLSNSPKYHIGALEFAIALALEKSTWGRAPKIFKAVHGAVKRNPHLYWAPSMPKFLEASLACENWIIVRRALELICFAGDTSFFQQVGVLSRTTGEMVERNEDYKTINVSEGFAAAERHGVLQRSVKNLLISKTEENTDIHTFKIAIAQALHELGFESPVDVYFECPEIVLKGHGFSAKLFAMPGGGASGASKLNSLLKKCELHVKADGVRVANDSSLPSFLQSDWGYSYFFLEVLRDVVRLNFVFVYRKNDHSKQKEFAKFTRYICVDRQ